jgi:hypothetical protein
MVMKWVSEGGLTDVDDENYDIIMVQLTLDIRHREYFTAGERSDSGINHCLRPRPRRGSREPM